MLARAGAATLAGMSDTPEIGHAAVIGASMSGLLAARALAPSCGQVTILERDKLPAVGEHRRAIPQGRHIHALLSSGQRAIEQLLPGVTEELLEEGAVRCTSLRDVRLEVAGHELTREAVGADVLLVSRPLLEGVVRRRVLGLADVAAREQCRVDGLAVASRGDRVTGVRVEGASGRETVDADLVVAACGRAASVPGWLAQHGYDPPAEDRLRVDLTYVSRQVRLRAGALDCLLVLIGARPGHPRGVGLMAQEGGRWMLTASGYGARHRPPSDEDGFVEFIATVAPPDVLAAIRESEPLGELVSHGFPANQRRRYERMKRFPEGLIVVGDAVASFNPLYGQGMSIAALEAVALERCLEQGANRLARRFRAAAARVAAPAWDMAVGGDLALPEVEGPRPLAVRVGNAYVERLLSVAEHDPVVAAAFNDVCDLVAAPAHIISPRVIRHVFRASVRRAVPLRRPLPPAKAAA